MLEFSYYLGQKMVRKRSVDRKLARSLDGLTPSQKAGIKLELGQNRWMGLIEKSL